MAKTISRTSDEIKAKWTPEKLAKLAKKPIRSFATGITEEDEQTGRVKDVGRGFAAIKKHIGHYGCSLVKDKKVTVGIRLPESVAAELRLTKWYSRYIADYVLEGFATGSLKLPAESRK